MRKQIGNRAVEQRIREAAQEAASVCGLQAPPIEQFLRSGKEAWLESDSGGAGLFDFRRDASYRTAARAAILSVFEGLAAGLPESARSAPALAAEAIRQRIEPIVRGLVQNDWQDVALSELTRRTFALNYRGTRAALEAELTTGWLGTAWEVLWIFFEDAGLKPDEIHIRCEGLSGGEYAHIRSSAIFSNDPYSDVIVHETAHLLHYLKPAQFGLKTRRGQERFVDVEFHRREIFAFSCEAYSRVILQGGRKSRIAFAAEMPEGAFSFPEDQIEEVAPLVLTAANTRNGWRTIRDATVTQRTRHSKSDSQALRTRR